MVSPINGDKPISVGTERSGASARNARSEQPSVAASRTPEHTGNPPEGAILDVEGARRLFDLENQSSRLQSAGISTPEAARSLLDQVLGQIGARPGEALKAQASQAAPPLANLLKTMPG